jgi:uncharacterized protein (TIRG00374 family)
MKSFKKISFILLRISVSIVILVFLFSRIDTKNIPIIFKSIDKKLLLIAFLTFFLGYTLCLIRWYLLLKGAKILIPFKRTISAFCGGVFFSLFLPTALGGDLVRSIDLSIHTSRPLEVVATVLLDRLSGYLSLVVMALVALIMAGRLFNDNFVFLAVGVITLLLIIILLVLFNQKIYAKTNAVLYSKGSGRVKKAIKNLHYEIHIFKDKKEFLIIALILSFFIQLLSVFTLYSIALSLGLKIGLIYFFIFLPLIGTISLLPSLGGLGVRDAATIFLFTKVGVAAGSAFTMSILQFLFIILCAGIAGVIYVITVHYRRV